MTIEQGAAEAETEIPALAEEPWNDAAEEELAKAVASLEGASFAQRLGRIAGQTLGQAGGLVPAGLIEAANAAAVKALGSGMRMVMTTLAEGRRLASRGLHLAAVATSGAVGGALGLLTLPIELPVSTAIILRSVADIAREEGEDLSDPATVLACVEVFALGNDRTGDPAGGAALNGAALGESGYFAIRVVLARSVSEAAKYLLQRGLADEAAPVLVRLLGQIASRFGLVVGQKLLAQAVPVIGAVAGAGINTAFMDHYQRLARAHFTVRRLERRHGAETVRAAYERLNEERQKRTAGTASPPLSLAKDGPSAVEAAAL